MERTYSISEISRITGVTRKTILARINRGEISAIRTNNRFVVTQSEMNRCFDLPVAAYAKKAPATKQAAGSECPPATSSVADKQELERLRYEVTKLRTDNRHLEDVRRILEVQLEECRRRLDTAEERQSQLISMIQVEQQPKRLGFTARMGEAFSVLLGKKK